MQYPTDDEILQRAEQILMARCVRDGDVLSDPAAARRLIQLRIATLAHEVFGVVYLDNRHRVLAIEELFRGTIDGCSVHPREVVKAALQVHNAAAVLLFHNHPLCGNPRVNIEDLLTT